MPLPCIPWVCIATTTNCAPLPPQYCALLCRHGTVPRSAITTRCHTSPIRNYDHSPRNHAHTILFNAYTTRSPAKPSQHDAYFSLPCHADTKPCPAIHNLALPLHITTVPLLRMSLPLHCALICALAIPIMTEPLRYAASLCCAVTSPISSPLCHHVTRHVFALPLPCLRHSLCNATTNHISATLCLCCARPNRQLNAYTGHHFALTTLALRNLAITLLTFSTQCRHNAGLFATVTAPRSRTGTRPFHCSATDRAR